MMPSREWLERMGDEEDKCQSVSVGGMMCDLNERAATMEPERMLVESGPERTVALRKLLEAKDAAVRARLHPGG